MILPAASRRLIPSVLAFSLVCGLVSPVARAEDAQEPSPARKLFVEARSLAQAGKYAEACPKFEESLRLEVGVGTQFNLADCWEHIGRTASAQALFLGAAASAKATGQPDREQVLRDRAAALEPRISRLVIEVSSTDPKLSVKRGELPIDADKYGKAVALDPAKYVISARAPGKQTWEKEVEISASTPVVTVSVPELKDAEPEKPVPVPVSHVVVEGKPQPAAQPSGSMEIQSDRHAPDWNYRAIAVAGFGVVALGVGTVAGLNFISANGDAKDVCPSSRQCSIKEIQTHDRLVDDARGWRRWAFAGFGVGTASLVGAGALWYFQRPKPGAKAAWQAAPVVSPDGSVGALVGGTF